MDEESEGGVCGAVSGVEEVEIKHAKALLEKAGDVPLDVARTILAAHYRTLRTCDSAGVKRLTGGFIQCPSCSTPWMADMCRPRLIGCPRNFKSIRRIARRSRTHPGKLTRAEKSSLARYYNRTNGIQVLCLVCGHRKEELFALPHRDKEEEEEEEKEELKEEKVARSKKKKRKGKELNAGLLLSSKVLDKTDSQTSMRKYSHLNTSTAITRPSKHTPDSQNTNQNFPSVRRNRAKVTIKSVSTPASLPVPLTSAMKEKRKAKCNLKKAMSKESARSDLYNGGGKIKNSLSSFLDSLL